MHIAFIWIYLTFAKHGSTYTKNRARWCFTILIPTSKRKLKKHLRDRWSIPSIQKIESFGITCMNFVSSFETVRCECRHSPNGQKKYLYFSTLQARDRQHTGLYNEQPKWIIFPTKAKYCKVEEIGREIPTVLLSAYYHLLILIVPIDYNCSIDSNISFYMHRREVAVCVFVYPQNVFLSGSSVAGRRK